MKYQNLAAFENHLAKAAKIQLARVFLVVSACSHERKKIALKIVSAIRGKEGEICFHTEDAARGDLELLIDGLNTTSLLEGKQVLCIDRVETLKKNGIERLARYVANPSPFSWLLIGAGSSKGLTELYAKGKKELIACDLSDEKPWDKKERLRRSSLEHAAKADRRLNPDALEFLLENVSLSLPALENEVDRLIAWAGERRELTLQDVRTLCTAQKGSTLWQLTDEIVWGELWPKMDEDVDLGLLLPLISQVRTQLQHGLTVSLLLERGAPQEEIAHCLPGIRPAAMDKMLPVAKVRQSPFFKRALDVLFEVELLAKNSALDPALILDTLLSKLHVLKRYMAGR